MFEIFKDRADQWRFRFRAANNRIVFISSEGYKNRKDVLSAIDMAKATNENTIVKEV
jgi:uncharacterized protein YegP (UPF0339 family)